MGVEGHVGEAGARRPRTRRLGRAPAGSAETGRRPWGRPDARSPSSSTGSWSYCPVSARCTAASSPAIARMTSARSVSSTGPAIRTSPSTRATTESATAYSSSSLWSTSSTPSPDSLVKDLISSSSLSTCSPSRLVVGSSRSRKRVSRSVAIAISRSCRVATG
ncbi:hypothetical protein [Streptosporangium longisporum]|uniref:hypothetical protein n=1 Tax=Streptosporangium longisporum TaxID=46187 RepID=UPI0031EDEBF2